MYRIMHRPYENRVFSYSLHKIPCQVYSQNRESRPGKDIGGFQGYVQGTLENPT